MAEDVAPPPKRLLLDALHRELGAKFAPFSGYDMPLQYEGLIAEHNWTRTKAGLFDVSHMGPSFLELPEGHGIDDPEEAHREIASVIERISPSDISGLKPGQLRYSSFLNHTGGILDDVMIGRPAATKRQDALYVVVNAGGKEADFELMRTISGAGAELRRADDRALLALQGPSAERVLGKLVPGAAALGFMHFAKYDTEKFGRVLVSRSGYTGENGFEILVLPDYAEAFARALLADPDVKPIGLGARDSLRLEAGLCLYGHDLDDTTSPIEADLAWTIQKRRRQAADFPGATRINQELAQKPARKRVGLRPKDRALAREGCEIVVNGAVIGKVSSGGFSPILNAPISMGYVAAEHAAPGTQVEILVRGTPRSAEIVPLPFVPHTYKKG